MKYESKWDTQYFESNVYTLVANKLEAEFTIQDFMQKFNKLSKDCRKTDYFKDFIYVVELYPTYHYHINIISNMLMGLVESGTLKVRWVSVKSRTEPIFIKQ